MGSGAGNVRRPGCLGTSSSSSALSHIVSFCAGRNVLGSERRERHGEEDVALEVEIPLL